MNTISNSVRVLQRMREAAGNPSYARIAEGVNGLPSESTIGRMFRGEVIPAIENVRVVVEWLRGNLAEYIDARIADGFDLNETIGEGPVPPKDFRQVASSADLNRSVETFVNALNEQNRIYAIHTQTRNDAFNRALETMREGHDNTIRVLKEKHSNTIKEIKNEHDKEIESLTRAHVREIASKDRWITLLAILAILCVSALIIMMIAAIRNPAVNLFGT